MGDPAVVDTSFRTAVRRLDDAGRLQKVSQELSVKDEIAGVMKAQDGGRALLFERVAGHGMPVLGNFLASPANCHAVFDRDTHGIRELMARGLSRPIGPETVDDPPSQEFVITDGMDLGAQLPVLRHAPGDAGRFITAGVVIVRDPSTGVHNASYHRLQLIGPDRTGIRLDHGRHLKAAFERAQQAGEALPISVSLGADVALLYAAAYMGSRMPETADELEAAGGLRGSPLPLASGVTQDVLVAAEAEIALEGVLDPSESVDEGPFGEFVGYPSDHGPAPVFHITALTHRQDPLYYAINGAGRETVMLRKYVLETLALDALRDAVPIVVDVDMSAGGLHRFHMVIQVAKQSPQHDGLQRNAILAALATLKDLDHVVVVDDDIDIRDHVDVEYAIATRVEASRDLFTIPAARGHEYVRVSLPAQGQRTKLGIDATVPFDDRSRFARADFESVALDPEAMTTAPRSSRLPWLTGREPPPR